MEKKSTQSDDRASGPLDAKNEILKYYLNKGRLAAGVAGLDAINGIAPARHRPAGSQAEIRYEISKCAELAEQYQAVPKMISKSDD